MTNLLGWARRNWVLLGALAFLIGSDYKFRTRDTTAAISGSVDGFILLELALYGTVAVALLATWVRPGRVLRAPELLLAALYLLLIVLSLPEAPYPEFASARAVEMLILGAFTLAVARRATSADMHRLAHGFLGLVAASVVLGFLVPSTPISTQQVGRFTWLAIHPTVAGVFLSIATVIGFVYITVRAPREGPHWPWWVYGGLLGIVALGLVASRTRSAVLGAVVGVVACQWAFHHGRRRLELVAVSLLVFAGIALTAVPTIEEYFARGESVEKLQTLNSRTDLWDLALEAVAKQPLYGYGVGASQGIFQDQVGLGGGHNAAVNVAVDLGGVGLAVWLALVIAILVGILRLPWAGASGFGVDRAVLVGVFLALQVNGIFYAGPGAPANVGATWLFLTIGWVVCVRRSAGEARPAVVDLQMAHLTAVLRSAPYRRQPYRAPLPPRRKMVDVP